MERAATGIADSMLLVLDPLSPAAALVGSLQQYIDNAGRGGNTWARRIKRSPKTFRKPAYQVSTWLQLVKGVWRDERLVTGHPDQCTVHPPCRHSATSGRVCPPRRRRRDA